MPSLALPTILRFLAPLVTLTLSLLSALSWYLTTKYYLPFPIPISAISTFSPLLDYFALASGIRSSSRRRNRNRNKSKSQLPLSPTVILINISLLLLNAVLVSLSSSYLPSSSISCPLEKQWQGYYSSKNAQAIGGIQTALSCCGLRSSVDKPYPFPSKSVNIKTCRNMLGVDRSCYADWEGKMKTVAGIVVSVQSLSGLFKMVILVVVIGVPGVMDRFAREEGEETEGRRLIEDLEEDEQDDNTAVDTSEVARRITRGGEEQGKPDERSRLLLPSHQSRQDEGSAVEEVTNAWSRE